MRLFPWFLADVLGRNKLKVFAKSASRKSQVTQTTIPWQASAKGTFELLVNRHKSLASRFISRHFAPHQPIIIFIVFLRSRLSLFVSASHEQQIYIKIYCRLLIRNPQLLWRLKIAFFVVRRERKMERIKGVNKSSQMMMMMVKFRVFTWEIFWASSSRNES